MHHGLFSSGLILYPLDASFPITHKSPPKYVFYFHVCYRTLLQQRNTAKASEPERQVFSHLALFL